MNKTIIKITIFILTIDIPIINKTITLVQENNYDYKYTSFEIEEWQE